MREVENLPFGPTARWTSLNLVGSFDRPPGCQDPAAAPLSANTVANASDAFPAEMGAASARTSPDVAKTTLLATTTALLGA